MDGSNEAEETVGNPPPHPTVETVQPAGPSSDNSELYQAIDEWVYAGQPLFDEVLTQLFRLGNLDKMTKLTLFSIAGGFSRAFSTRWKQSEAPEDHIRLSESIMAGMTRLSMTPEISAMAENMIQSKVNEKVGDLV